MLMLLWILIGMFLNRLQVPPDNLRFGTNLFDKEDFIHLFYIVFAGISCGNINNEAPTEYDSVLESAELSENELQRKEITLKQLTSLKLKAYFELITLQKIS